MSPGGGAEKSWAVTESYARPVTTYEFEGEPYPWRTDRVSWTFVDLPQELSDEVEDARASAPSRFGAVRVEVVLGGTTWRTSLFPSKERGTFVLPVKKAVMRAEGVEHGDRVSVRFSLVE